jgi:hypothetical protein
MKHLCILIISLAIYLNAFFSFSMEKKENLELINSKFTNCLDTIKLNEESLISVDSNVKIPSNEFVIPKDTSNIIQTELPVISSDTIGLIKNEQPLLPLDSTGLIHKEILIPADSLKVIQNVTNDTIQRIIYRSVYADSIEQQNPNFITRKVLEIKWITEKRDTVIRYKNIIGLNLFYGIYTYGFGAGIFKRLSNDADFIANINLSYVFDRRTNEDIDTNMNINTLIKESRMYPIVFNVGLEKYFMQNRIDWKVKPVLIFGFAPAIIPVVPYELTFFKSLKKIQLSYGLGVFAALGFDWQAFRKFGINLTARYSFIPIIAGKDIYYYKGFLVKNIGGFYVNLGVTLLQEYFGKK